MDLPRAACTVILGPEGKVLGVSRLHDRRLFGLPGGKVEPGESDVRAARRETLEETGFVVRLEQRLYEGVCYSDTPHHTSAFLATITDWRGPPAPHETGKVAWIDWFTLFAGPFGDYNRRLYDVVRRKGVIRSRA